MICRNVDSKILIKSFMSMRNYRKSTPLFNDYNNSNKKFKRKPKLDLIGMAIESIQIEKPQDWGTVREFVLKHECNKSQNYNAGNIDGMIMGCCVSRLKRMDWAKMYLKYLEDQSIKPNLATIGYHLRMLFENNLEKLSKEDEKEIFKVCEHVEKNYPILDGSTQENIVMALSVTNQWKKCLALLEEIKITSVPSVAAYSALISAAFSHKEESLAWDLLREMVENKLEPSNITFQAYLKTLKRLKKHETIVQKLEKLFLFLKETELICQEGIADTILEFSKLSGNKTTVKFSGQCDSCNSKLEKFELSENEFSELKKAFFKNVLVGRDIFTKSDPAEMEEFQIFVSKMGKFDVVLDGLNIAYSAGINKGPQVFSRMIAAVISHFKEQNKTVLMLGRVHMTRWPKYYWNYITQNSAVFLTKNLSQDDPYLLYCALHSGRDTIVVTRDLMRSHKYLLKERKYKVLFDRWLSQRQYFLLHVNDQNRANFRKPPHFSTIAQKNGHIWHIPYIPESENTIINEKFHRTWLCLNCNK